MTRRQSNGFVRSSKDTLVTEILDWYYVHFSQIECFALQDDKNDAEDVVKIKRPCPAAVAGLLRRATFRGVSVRLKILRSLSLDRGADPG